MERYNWKNFDNLTQVEKLNALLNHGNELHEDYQVFVQAAKLIHQEEEKKKLKQKGQNK